MRKIAILGSTGSIGTQTLEIVREQNDICVTALAAGGNIDLLEKQIREFAKKYSGWGPQGVKQFCEDWDRVTQRLKESGVSLNIPIISKIS